MGAFDDIDDLKEFLKKTFNDIKLRHNIKTKYNNEGLQLMFIIDNVYYRVFFRKRRNKFMSRSYTTFKKEDEWGFDGPGPLPVEQPTKISSEDELMNFLMKLRGIDSEEYTKKLNESESGEDPFFEYAENIEKVINGLNLGDPLARRFTTNHRDELEFHIVIKPKKKIPFRLITTANVLVNLDEFEVVLYSERTGLRGEFVLYTSYENEDVGESEFGEFFTIKDFISIMTDYFPNEINKTAFKTINEGIFDFFKRKEKNISKEEIEDFLTKNNIEYKEDLNIIGYDRLSLLNDNTPNPEKGYLSRTIEIIFDVMKKKPITNFKLTETYLRPMGDTGQFSEVEIRHEVEEIKEIKGLIKLLLKYDLIKADKWMKQMNESITSGGNVDVYYPNKYVNIEKYKKVLLHLTSIWREEEERKETGYNKTRYVFWTQEPEKSEDSREPFFNNEVNPEPMGDINHLNYMEVYISPDDTGTIYFEGDIYDAGMTGEGIDENEGSITIEFDSFEGFLKFIVKHFSGKINKDVMNTLNESNSKHILQFRDFKNRLS